MTPSDALPPLVLRHALGRTLAVAWWVLAPALLLAGGWPPGVRGVLVAAGVSGLLWSTCWRPAVVLDGDGVTVVNPLRDIRIDWPALDEAEFGWALRLRAGEVTCVAAAAPGPAQMSVLYDRHVTPGGVLERDAVSRDSIVAPALLAVRQRWAASGGGPAAGGVSVRRPRASAAVLAASAALLVAAASAGALSR